MIVLMMIVVMMVTAVTALVVIVVMMVTAGATLVMVMLVVMTAGATLVVIVVMVMTAGATFMMLMAVMMVVGMLPCCDGYLGFHSPGDLCQLWNQGIRILCRETKLFGGEGDGSLLHLRQGIDFGFYLGRAVGAVQIINDINLLGHNRSS